MGKQEIEKVKKDEMPRKCETSFLLRKSELDPRNSERMVET
jgi:hypothetical protein